MPGFYDDNTARFIPGSSVGSEYELETHDQQSLDDIKNRLEKKKFRQKDQVMESIEFLENLNNKLSQIIRNEEAAGNDNWTLKQKHKEILELFARLKQEYSRLD